MEKLFIIFVLILKLMYCLEPVLYQIRLLFLFPPLAELKLLQNFFKLFYNNGIEIKQIYFFYII